MPFSSALLTDRYELTMLDAALTSGTHERASLFEVFARGLPEGRRYGVVAGTGRLLELIREFRFGDAELTWLRDQDFLSDQALDLLASYRFSGDIRGYREGELYFPDSPILEVEAPFWEGVLLETLILSVLNFDSAIASAASRMVTAAQGRPVNEMGSRRAHEHAAVAAARAAWIAGFSATSNLEAGRTWGLPTMGTAAHAFTLLHDTEEDAFRAQVASFGPDTTLLIDTYEIEAAVATAVKVAGPGLGAVRIDSGDLTVVAADVRRHLDALGATRTQITVTNDLNEYSIAALAAAPVDTYGVGTALVTGSGAPTAGMVYKLVARQDSTGKWQSVAKTSVGKANIGGRKHAFRRIGAGGTAIEEIVAVEGSQPENAPGSGLRDRALTVPLVRTGVVDAAMTGHRGTALAREHHARAMEELPLEGFRLGRGEPAIPTRHR